MGQQIEVKWKTKYKNLKRTRIMYNLKDKLSTEWYTSYN